MTEVPDSNVLTIPVEDVQLDDTILVHQNGCNPDDCNCCPWQLVVASRHRPTNGIAVFKDSEDRECLALVEGEVQVLYA